MIRLTPLILLLACGPTETPEAPSVAKTEPAPSVVEEVVPEDAPSSEDEALLRKADGAIDTLQKSLGSALMAKMKESGPVEALSFCHEQAGPLTEGAAETSGVAVGRSSVKLRNPTNDGPAWVQSWLTTYGAGTAAAAQPLREVVTEEGVRHAHVIRPIVIQPPCLQCHGTAEQLAPGVAEALAEAYPDDKATGYAVGDLRGVFWADATE